MDSWRHLLRRFENHVSEASSLPEMNIQGNFVLEDPLAVGTRVIGGPENCQDLMNERSKKALKC